jgi:hypothetical protein
MKITVDLPDKAVRDICRFAGERKKGPAIRKMALENLNWRIRQSLLDKFASGEWSVDLPDWRELRKERDLSWQ